MIENSKHSLIWQQNKCSEIVRSVLQDFHCLRKPHSTALLRKKLDMSPFEDALPLERAAKRQDASLFAVGSHSKKRPHNLVIGRMFDSQLLDMVEFGVTNYKTMEKSAATVNVADGSKPCLVFQGDAFANDESAQRVMNLMLDFFRGDTNAATVNILGLDHVIVVTALSKDVLLFDHCAVKLSSSGTATPKVDLENIGPSMTLTVRRTRFASSDLWREANKIPPQLKKSASRNKNILVNEVTGERLGRIHMQQQPIDEISLRKFKAMRKKNRLNDEADAEALAEGDDVARFDPDELFAARSSKKQRRTVLQDEQSPDGLRDGRNKNRPMQHKSALEETMDEFQ